MATSQNGQGREPHRAAAPSLPASLGDMGSATRVRALRQSKHRRSVYPRLSTREYVFSAVLR